jgi:hypothetical protein
MMEQHLVEDDPLRMSRTIDSRHGGRMVSRNGPTSRIGPRLPGKTGKAPAQRGKSSEKTSTGVDARPGEWKRRGTIDDRGTRLFVKETYKTTLVKVEPSEIFVDDLEDRSRHFVSCASILPSSCPP